MPRLLTRAALALLVAAFVAPVWAGAPASAQTAPTPVTTPEQCVTLTQMGIGPVEATHLTTTGLIKQFSFTLPDGAVQGPTDWYMIRFHVAVTAAPGATGTALVTAETDGRTDAQVEYKLSAAGMDWSTVSIAEPFAQDHSVSGTAVVTLANYLQDSGVRGGVNTAAFRVELDHGARLDDVRVLPDTCFERTSLSPEEMKVDSQMAPARPTAGRTVTVRIRVTNTGTRPVTRLNVTVDPMDAGLVPVSAGTVSTTNMTRQWVATFTFRADRPGKHQVHLNVSTAISPTYTTSIITVAVGRSVGTQRARWPLAAAAITVLLGGMWLLLRRRPTRTRVQRAARR